MAAGRAGGTLVTTMRQAAQRYLLLRRSLGYELEEPGRLLLDFADYLDAAGVTHLTIEAVVAWATAPQGAAPYWHWLRLSAVRGFAAHLHAIDPGHQVPPADLLPRQYTRAAPYLFSDDEVAALMRAAGRMRRRMPAATYQALIGLLAVTGLRPGEAYRLNRDDLDADRSTLTVVRGKYGKSRELILRPCAITALQEYGRHRDQLCPHPAGPSLLVSMRGTRLNVISTERVFVRLASSIGLQPRSDRTRPRLKDLRHTFAVSTLIGWYQAGVDVNARLPALSTWLGHVDPQTTYWYLQASPELLALAAEKINRYHHPEAFT
jgi:integrase/recombinase XerD